MARGAKKVAPFFAQQKGREHETTETYCCWWQAKASRL